MIRPNVSIHCIVYSDISETITAEGGVVMAMGGGEEMADSDQPSPTV